MLALFGICWSFFSGKTCALNWTAVAIDLPSTLSIHHYLFSLRWGNIKEERAVINWCGPTRSVITSAPFCSLVYEAVCFRYYNFYYTDYNKKNDNINQWQKRQTKRMYHPEKYPPGKTMVARAQAVNAYGQSELSDIYTFPTTVGGMKLKEHKKQWLPLTKSKLYILNQIGGIPQLILFFSPWTSLRECHTRFTWKVSVAFDFNFFFYIARFFLDI